MLCIAMAKVKAGTPQERIARRAEWRYPEGVRVVAEYWPLGGGYAVVTVPRCRWGADFGARQGTPGEDVESPGAPS